MINPRYFAAIAVACLAVSLAGCDRGLDLRISLQDGGSRVSVAGFREGLFFGAKPISFCPDEISVEEQLRDGSYKNLLRMKRREHGCEPHHQWSIPLVTADGRPLLAHYTPNGPISISIITDQSEIGSSAWISLRP